MAKKKPSGTAGMRKTGKSPVQLWFTPAERARIAAAARAENLPVTQFLERQVLAASEKNSSPESENS
jgi:hypothetical protein